MTQATFARRSSRGTLLHLGPGLVYIAYIFFAGTARTEGFPVHVSDKLMHFAAFGAMVPLVYLAVRWFYPAIPTFNAVAISAVVASVLGALLEFVQSFLPYRDAEFLDWVADTAGAMLFGIGTLVLLLVVARVRPSDRSA